MKTRKQIIQQLEEYFIIQELVGPEVYTRHKEDSWQFLATEALSVL